MNETLAQGGREVVGERTVCSTGVQGEGGAEKMVGERRRERAAGWDGWINDSCYSSCQTS